MRKCLHFENPKWTSGNACFTVFAVLRRIYWFSVLRLFKKWSNDNIDMYLCLTSYNFAYRFICANVVCEEEEFLSIGIFLCVRYDRSSKKSLYSCADFYQKGGNTEDDEALGPRSVSLVRHPFFYLNFIFKKIPHTNLG